ncbi:hypothetical protein [Clostridium sp. CCUG 7971]|uniref:hypothetical protein n=1 Tax=Clostridium sp. CCUG 7971 TaxID=2811414 RepID=UPI001ABBBDB8|nr:hypothetical protein [Clostridium sp. CCUG 7971]MBO3444882.1 hypothetical protein [Clostridium sp. CCUG 7971]
MSFYTFIACEYELPTLYSSKLHKADGTKITTFQYEDDLNDLEITPGSLYYDVSYYTKLSKIYDLNFRYTEDRCQRLYDYLINNCKNFKKCEIWSIWLANCSSKKNFHNDISKELENLKEVSLSLSELTFDKLKKVLDSYETPRKLLLY